MPVIEEHIKTSMRPQDAVKIFREDSTQQEMASIEKHQSDPTEINRDSLLILPDYCLLKVFHGLDVKMICHMANVCQRFRIIAENIFSRRLVTIKKLRQHRSYNGCEVIYKFGNSIKKLEVHNLTSEESTEIAKYCPKLEYLSMHKSQIDVTTYKSVFEKLKYLNLDSCDILGNEESLHDTCAQLEELNFNSQNFAIFSKYNFPKLTKLKFGYVERWQLENVFQFFHQNLQIEYLVCGFFPGDNEIKNIINYAGGLETLEFQPYLWNSTRTREGFVNLANIKTLKKLVFPIYGEDYNDLTCDLAAAMLQKNVAIETLRLTSFKMTRFDLKKILELKTLKRICLSKLVELDDDDLISIGNELPLLEKLEIITDFSEAVSISKKGLLKMVQSAGKLTNIKLRRVRGLVIDQNAFESLTQILKERDSQLTIKILVHRFENNFDVPLPIQKANRSALNIHWEKYRG